MNKNRIATGVCCMVLFCGCSITGHLERRQYRADVLHVSREQREREQQAYQPPVLKIERDSNRFYLVPTEVQENGKRIMAMQIQEVTIRARARTLPERLGKVTIDFVIDMPRQLQGTCRSVVVTPYLHKYGEAHPLQDITIRAVLAGTAARLLAVRQICPGIRTRQQRRSPRICPVREISLPPGCAARQRGRTSRPYLVLLFAGSADG
jgi:hypothetical protein